MSATLPVADHAVGAPDADAGTRQRVLSLVAAQGPIAAPELADQLDLTVAGIRRHLGELLAAEQIAVHEAPAAATGRRGRPARRYVVTSRGQSTLSQRYSELAAQALRFLSTTGGAQAVEGFAEQRVRDLEAHLALVLADRADLADRAGRADNDIAERARLLAQGLTDEGYAASARPVPGTHAVQLCQGHCPVQDVAREFPQLCEAETRAFSRLLGVHVQRLSTLAGGGHVCTTSIPTTSTPITNTPMTNTRSTAPTSPPGGPTR